METNIIKQNRAFYENGTLAMNFSTLCTTCLYNLTALIAIFVSVVIRDLDTGGRVSNKDFNCAVCEYVEKTHRLNKWI